VHRLHGMPTFLISDRDLRFTAKFWKTYTRLIGTKLNMSSAHHPQTDGQTERVHRTLEEMLRHYVHSNPSAWEEMLPAVEFAYNTAKQASTGRSPFYMLYGRHPRTPAAFLQELPQQELARDATNPAAVHWIRNAKTALEQATACLRKAQERQERYANQTRKEQTFKVGDQVLLSPEPFERAAKGSGSHWQPFRQNSDSQDVAIEFNQDMGSDAQEPEMRGEIAEGSQVKHPTFGIGVVKARRGDIVDIVFGGGVKKTFALSIAPLQII